MVPFIIHTKFVPSGAGISIPLCIEVAPEVGAVRLPKYELILVYPGIGQINLLFSEK